MNVLGECYSNKKSGGMRNMYYYYKVFGFIVRSEFEIRQLMPAEETQKYDMDVVFENVPKEIMADIENPELSNRYHWTAEYIWLKNIYGIFSVRCNCDHVGLLCVPIHSAF